MAVYLIQNGNSNMYKVGYTNSIKDRQKAYITTNPEIRFLEYVQTKKTATGRQLEAKIHQEMKDMGFKQIINHNVKTEWFVIPEGNVSLTMFENCKNRKIYVLEDRQIFNSPAM